MSVDIQRVERNQLSCWRIRRGDAELLVAEQGAQVLSYRLGDEPPIIWLSEDALFQKRQPVRGGIPVCWPWFGELERNPQSVRAQYHGKRPAPAHGLVRALDWALERQTADGGIAQLGLRCTIPAGGLPGWPHALELQLHIQLDDRLHLRLTSHNHGDAPVTIGQALHSYFAISDIHQVSVAGLAGRRYIDALANWDERHQQDELRFYGETDRIYLDLPDTLDVPDMLTVKDPGWNRRISLQTSNSSSAVVWNPWIAKSRRLSQFADDAWQRMLCIETANVMDDVVRLEPDTSHSLSLSIQASTLR